MYVCMYVRMLGVELYKMGIAIPMHINVCTYIPTVHVRICVCTYVHTYSSYFYCKHAVAGLSFRSQSLKSFKFDDSLYYYCTYFF